MNIFFISSLLTLGTFLGSLLALFLRNSPISVGVSLSFTGGVMLVASFTSLILPGLEVGTFLEVASGIVLGFALMALLENVVPHEHTLKGREGYSSTRVNRLYLIVLAVLLHNIPEGLSVGISSAYSLDKGFETAVAIALQDVPEGFVVSLPLMVMTGKLMIPLWVGFFSGFLETLFSLTGFFLFETFKEMLAVGLGFGGGAMVYITAKEVFPEAYAEGKHTQSTLAFLLGLLLMLFLDTSL
ncbi:MAG: ZIP family metal transporter [Aquificaceae bacterium]|nr:ZIP family metal transporter [Aquificaceae bacterium]MCS7195875.1 ZIP family metal transporter [Aquificaceae bacterium]MCX7989126.1 ZIP family metal transporter [Aquificaceae bacterium]MDW8032334.1 ZIP family metal transporter [Aquificaceae bacterium]MDW8294064.1 ZIP family metal transporter [Aquificaceae bacterium]